MTDLKDITMVDWARAQFALTAMYHWLFVPLTLGLSVLVAIMETQYARTGDETYLRMTRFWGKLFLINFVIEEPSSSFGSIIFLIMSFVVSPSISRSGVSTTR